MSVNIVIHICVLGQDSSEGIEQSCIYLQLEPFQDAGQSLDGEDESTDSSTPEVRLVPSDPDCCKNPWE